jgi:predicted KAP-like P-loop ATPase
MEDVKKIKVDEIYDAMIKYEENQNISFTETMKIILMFVVVDKELCNKEVTCIKDIVDLCGCFENTFTALANDKNYSKLKSRLDELRFEIRSLKNRIEVIKYPFSAVKDF